jgi:hypothetical protein
MQTLTIQVKDDFMSEVTKFIETAKDNIVVQKDNNLKLDPYFYERQKDLQKTIDEIESGKMPTYDFESSMDKLIQELEN